jgi:hypothetical protein
MPAGSALGNVLLPHRLQKTQASQPDEQRIQSLGLESGHLGETVTVLPVRRVLAKGTPDRTSLR